MAREASDPTGSGTSVRSAVTGVHLRQPSVAKERRCGGLANPLKMMLLAITLPNV